MNLIDQNILIFSRSTQHGGTENLVLQLCDVFRGKVNKVIVCAASGFNLKKVEELDALFYEIPDIENKNPAIVLQVLRRVSQIIKKEEITIIHTQHRMAAFYASILSRKYHILFINTSHNTFTNKKKLTQYAYRRAHLIACGEMVKRNLVEVYGIPEQRVTVIHNASYAFEDEIIVDPIIKKLHEQGYFVIGNVGRLSEQKGMEYFIDSIPAILRIHPMTKFLIIGSGELEEELRKRVNDKNLDDSVVFMGYRSDIQNLMSQLDLIVLSSLWEGFPLTPIEAFSVGKTVVATGVDGTTEIIQNEKNGLIVEPRKPDQIAEAVCRLIEDNVLRIKCEKNLLKKNTLLKSLLKDIEHIIKICKRI